MDIGRAKVESAKERAEAVKRYLMEKYSLTPDHLVTAGYGKMRLKNKDNPRAPENRRVSSPQGLAPENRGLR